MLIRRHPDDSTAERAGGAAPGLFGAPALNRPALTSAIILAVIMQGVDNSIANVALPHMQGSLSASQDQIAWVLTSYIVTAAITMPLAGWLATRFGIKPVFMISIGGFTLASFPHPSPLSFCLLFPSPLRRGGVRPDFFGPCPTSFDKTGYFPVSKALGAFYRNITPFMLRY